jgi:hypothetical protein
MTHGDAIVHGDGVEFLGDTTSGFNLTAHQLTPILEVNVTGYELGKGVGDCNDWASQNPQCAFRWHARAHGHRPYCVPEWRFWIDRSAWRILFV